MDSHQPIPRRGFLATAAVTAAASGPLLAADSDVRRLTPAHFQPLVGERFSADGIPLVLRRCDVQQLARGDARPFGSRQPFSLLFELSHPSSLPSDTVQLQHPQVGEVKLHVSESPDVVEGRHYVEAVFS